MKALPGLLWVRAIETSSEFLGETSASITFKFYSTDTVTQNRSEFHALFPPQYDLRLDSPKITCTSSYLDESDTSNIKAE
jgi:hypothetical protein